MPALDSTAQTRDCQTPENIPIRIPAEIACRTDLSMAAKLLFGLIDGLCKKHGHCWASNAHLAGRIGVKPVYVSRLIAELRDLRLIVAPVRQSEGNQRKIHLGAGYSPNGQEVARRRAQDKPNGTPPLPKCDRGLAQVDNECLAQTDKQSPESEKEKSQEMSAAPTPQPHAQPSQAATASGVFSVKGKREEGKEEPRRPTVMASKEILETANSPFAIARRAQQAAREKGAWHGAT